MKPSKKSYGPEALLLCTMILVSNGVWSNSPMGSGSPVFRSSFEYTHESSFKTEEMASLHSKSLNIVSESESDLSGGKKVLLTNSNESIESRTGTYHNQNPEVNSGDGQTNQSNNPATKSTKPVKAPGCKVMFKDASMVTISRGKIIQNDHEALQKAINKGSQNHKVILIQEPSIENEEHPGGMDPKPEEGQQKQQNSETNYVLPDSTNVIIKALKPKGHTYVPGHGQNNQVASDATGQTKEANTPLPAQHAQSHRVESITREEEFILTSND
ncbi:MAG: hypothetical protein IPP69_15505 [Flavobacteriales bacterium]|nr:hypothetical protein [Flavobacteriales bacterium]